MKQLERTINSLEIAGMVGRDHSKVIRDMRSLIKHLNEAKIGSVNYFIESTYKDAKGEERPCFDCTKKGCELYSTRMTGAKGTQFAAAYIDRFNEMERQLKAPASNTELLLETALKHERDLVEVNGRIDKLETETTINSSQRRKISGAVTSTVVKVLGGKKSNAYRDSNIRPTAFSQCYREVRELYDVASYMDIPKIKYEEALTIIPKWKPRFELRARIDHANGLGSIWEESE
ncbi:phage regulatory protein [Enterococcus casseliflavus]|uniref:Phage regulatory protein n=1 Tax=Enterococcus casseliflavus TaxID=37734 RepID=A0A415ELT7_ENTCA|nr:phage regulatory protein [Enterococcus casseliflavus]